MTLNPPRRDVLRMDAIKTYVEALEDDEDRFGQATETTVDRESRPVEVTWASTLESPD